ncbi:DNA-3-methyladenine glycosylase I [Propionicicella superfundia]|uniref:DNA-3-methyladenine glycosylase I n=1 Tax=Propionicicella superfundia TaxID=348582 RepID=UPI0004202360|nr:DNA-3-methyladenine glycosylase I [Propionicicella superfundia]
MTVRCFGTGDALYEAYHDDEWGRPVHGDADLFERFSLEAFQSGLSWLTILRKREGFRRAFAGFDPAAVAEFAAADVDRLLLDAAIVRNRRKIEAVIANARALVALQGSGRTLTDLVWSHRPARHRRPRSLAELPATTPESVSLAKALKAVGFVFVGPTTAYASMQACGIVNDHLVGCPAGTQAAAGA